MEFGVTLHVCVEAQLEIWTNFKLVWTNLKFQVGPAQFQISNWSRQIGPDSSWALTYAP